MQKVAVIFSFILVCLNCHAQNKIPSADEILKPVYAQAARENKKVLLIFHASWCGWCRKMDASLRDNNIQPLTFNIQLIVRSIIIRHLVCNIFPTPVTKIYPIFLIVIITVLLYGYNIKHVYIRYLHADIHR